MKILFVAQLSKSHDRDQLWITEFEERGWSLSLFSTYEYEIQHENLIGKLRNRLHSGPIYKRMQDDLIHFAASIRPDWIHFRMPIHFTAKTIEELKKHINFVSCYYNDDPFAKRQPLFLSSLFLKALPYYDHHFVFRNKNIREFYQEGAKSVTHLEPFYSRDKFISLDSQFKDFSSDAVFIGHWEDDCRQVYMEQLAKAGFQLVVRGSIWSSTIKSGSTLKGPFDLIFGRGFSELYRGARAGLCFFSKLNNDTWTRRPLEIVASGGLLVCERTDEAMRYFDDGKEAFFFSSYKELLEIMHFIKLNPDKAFQVRKSGQARLMSSQYSISDRVNEMLDIYKR